MANLQIKEFYHDGQKVSIDLHENFASIGDPRYFEVYYLSGRGPGKSWAAGIKTLINSTQRPHFNLFGREVQKSLRDSSQRLLKKFIWALNMNDFYKVSRDNIEGANGSEFVFYGLHDDANAIRSLEGLTQVILEEAQLISEPSLETLGPTVRADDSQIVYLMNPRFPDDPVYKRSQIPDPDAITYYMDYRDNLHRSAKMDRDIAFDKKLLTPERFNHKWLGKLLIRSDAQIFTNWEVVPGGMDKPHNAMPLVGIDWGYSSSPLAAVLGWLWERTIYVEKELYQRGVTTKQIPGFLFGADTWANKRWPTFKPHWEGIPEMRLMQIIADSARPETIAELKDMAINIRGAKKGPQSVMEGINFLQGHKIYVHSDCENMIDELSFYRWKMDKKTDMPTDIPVDENNHLLDALRYSTEPYRNANWDAPPGIQTTIFV